MKLLLTGASGFFGSNLIELLTKHDVEVHALRRGQGPAETAASAPVRWHQADLFDESSVSQVLAELRPTHLCHMAWLGPEHADRYRAPANVEWVTASKRLFEAFRRSGGERLVQLGSCIEYGNLASGIRTEQQSLAPDTAYGQAKADLSHFVETIGDDLATTVARPFFCYGPHEQLERLVPSIVLALDRGETIDLTEGRQRRDYLHSHDVAAALWALIDSMVTGPFNIGAGVGVEVRSIAEHLGRIADRSELLHFGARPEGADSAEEIVADITRITSETSWAPAVTLEAGLQQTTEWLLAGASDG